MRCQPRDQILPIAKDIGRQPAADTTKQGDQSRRDHGRRTAPLRTARRGGGGRPGCRRAHARDHGRRPARSPPTAPLPPCDAHPRDAPDAHFCYADNQGARAGQLHGSGTNPARPSSWSSNCFCAGRVGASAGFKALGTHLRAVRSAPSAATIGSLGSHHAATTASARAARNQNDPSKAFQSRWRELPRNNVPKAT